MTNPPLEFRSLPGLWRDHATRGRSLAFSAQTEAEARQWQRHLRLELATRLGGFAPTSCPLDPHLLERRTEPGFTSELIALQTMPGEYMPCFVLIPDQPASIPLKPIIALHGHGTWGAEAIVHTPPDPQAAAFNRQLNYEYAGELARRGYLVFAPELRGFGRRLEDPEYREGDDPWISSCYQVAVNALLLGKTLLGMRVYDVTRLIDYIFTRPEPISQTLGCVGLSGGGMATLFVTALDERITCAVVSGYFNTFRDSIMAIRHCLCNFVPGLAQAAEIVDIAGLVAPRPLLIESGTRDPIFPLAATRRAFGELMGIYTIFGAIDRLDSDIFEGEHQWSGAKAYHWLARWL